MTLKPNRDRVTFDGKLHNESKLSRHASYQDKKTKTNNFASVANVVRVNSTKVKRIQEDENFDKQAFTEDKISENGNLSLFQFH